MMTVAERAAELERRDGRTLADFPYTEADYRNITRLSGLDKIRGVRDVSLRKLCWALYWITEASSPPPRDDEWRMSDDDFDTTARRIPDDVNGVLRAEWDGFNKKMDRWCAKRYRETGVMVSDSQRREHTARFAAILRKKYGASYPEDRTGDPGRQ